MTSLSVNVTAEVTDLQTKMALAQSELRAFNAETRSLADQMRAGGEAAQSSLLPQLHLLLMRPRCRMSQSRALMPLLPSLLPPSPPPVGRISSRIS